MNIIVGDEDEFKYKISNIDKCDNDNYLDLIKSIKKAFNLNAEFSLYEKIGGDHMDIDDMDDIKNAFLLEDEDNNGQSTQYKDTLHLYVKMIPDDDDKKEEISTVSEIYEIDDHDGLDDKLDVDDDQKHVTLEQDDLYKWCKKNGFDKYYDQFIDDFGIDSLDDIIDASMDDLFGICDELKFTDDERVRFLNIIIVNNENNELLTWCKKNKLDKFYELLIKCGYFSPTQIGKLSKQKRINLCKELGIKFGAKKRFENGLPGIADIKHRKLIQIKSDISPNDDTVENRTILMVGETGTGKTATINSMMNYLYGAQFEGDRYKLIQEKFDDKKETESQTNEISVYYLRPPEISYALTIVDTPGFGNCDSKGIQFDQVIIQKLEHLFKTEVTEIDGICFVIKSSTTRLNQLQQYVFTEIISIFGENVANNIILLFTFDDGSNPLGLKAVNNSKPTIPHRDKYFTFNNNGFDFDLDEKKRYNFEAAMETFGDFFEELTKTQTQSLQLSQHVLQQRRTLKCSVKLVQQKLKNGLTIYQSIINRIKYIKENKDKINKKDESTLLTVEVPESKKVVVRKKRSWFKQKWTDKKIKEEKEEKMPLDDNKLESFWVCQDCKLTCQMSLRNEAVCSRCKQYASCSDSIICVKYKYELVLKEIKVPIKQLPSGYLDASLYQPLSDILIEEATIKLEQAEYDLIELIATIRKCINKIKELALNKSILKPNDYFNLLIQEEKRIYRDGWQDRVKALRSLQKQHKLIETIEKSVEAENIESIFPEFNKITTFQQETEEKENERINKMKTKNFVDLKREKERTRQSRKSEFRKKKFMWLWEKQVYNYTYKDFLKDFRGHIIETEDRGYLIQLERAAHCCWVSGKIYDDNYKTKKFKNYNQITPFTRKASTGSFLQRIRWMILYPKPKINKNPHTVFLVFKGTSEFLELITNLAATPQKIFSNNKVEEIEGHSGIYGALMKEFEEISNELQKLKIGDANNSIKKIYITGHSVGGGLAILFAYEMIRRGLINQQSIKQQSIKHCQYEVITFGAPSVLACSQKTAIQKLMIENKDLQLLNNICHCYTNRLDPVPRLMHLLYELPDIMENVMSEMIEFKTAKLKAFGKKIDIKKAIKTLKSKDLSSVYFSVGKQYIWCGQHKKSYCGEEMKVRTKYDIVTSFDISRFKNVNEKLWREMWKDQLIQSYYQKCKSKTTII